MPAGLRASRALPLGGDEQDLVVTSGREAVSEPVGDTAVVHWDTEEPSERGIEGIERKRPARDDIAARVDALAAELDPAARRRFAGICSTSSHRGSWTVQLATADRIECRPVDVTGCCDARTSVIELVSATAGEVG